MKSLFWEVAVAAAAAAALIVHIPNGGGGGGGFLSFQPGLVIEFVIRGKIRNPPALPPPPGGIFRIL